MPLRTLAVALLRGVSPYAVPSAPAAPAQKASATAPLIALHHTGQPVWSPRDYAAFAREGYARNPIVYRAVRMIAEAAASLPLRLFEGGTEVDAHPLIDLLAQPNAGACGPDLLEDWYGYLLIAGNAYMEAVGVGGAPRELHVLRPDRMKIVPGTDGWPEAYEYTANGLSTRFRQSPEEGVRPILHMALFNPSNDYYGMSPIEAAASAVDLHNAASGWNKALLDNAARPSGALVYSAADGHLSEEQFARLKSELETNYQGAMNAGRPLLLEGGLDWKAMSLSPAEMDFIEAEARGEPRDRAGAGRAADAARHSRRQHLRELRRGEPGALAADGVAGGDADAEGAVGLARAAIRRRAGVAARAGSDRRAGERPHGAVGPDAAGGFPHRRREARRGRLWAAGGRRITRRPICFAATAIA